MDTLEFEWDQWNVQKNEEKHGISRLEAESVFFDGKLKVFSDIRHSTAAEKRWICFGMSGYQNILMIAFTRRKGRVRIISARKASRKERMLYEES